MKIKESTIVQCVGAKAQDWKMGWTMITKNNNGRNFQFTKFLFIDFAHTDRRSLSGTRPKSACGKTSNCRFCSQLRGIPLPKPLSTQLSLFLFVYWFSSPSRKVWTSPSVRDTDFLAAMIRESSDKLPCIENREGFAVHLSTWPSGAKGEWRVSSWLAISNTREKMS